ncbi:MAG: hypothetical protein FJZ87_13920 [Chloroflexi bacterium]|nr:hypothetical protein [Chloroflexota bacterium]
MHSSAGRIYERFLDGTLGVECPVEAIPGPGQYSVGYASSSQTSLGVPLFTFGITTKGFRAIPDGHPGWTIGARLSLRGPLGRGFTPPGQARRISFVSWNNSGIALRSLVSQTLSQDIEMAFLAENAPKDLPELVEVQPIEAIEEVCAWADFVALEAAVDDLDRILNRMTLMKQPHLWEKTQVLIRTPMPCGALAACGACAVQTRKGWKMACKDGPVFNLGDLTGAE